MNRSLLYVPGNSPKMIINSAFFNSDALIFDLEDAVAPFEKDAARILVRYALSTLDFGKKKKIVRINSIDAPYWEADIRSIVPVNPDYIMPAKIESAETIDILSKKISELEISCGLSEGTIRLIPLIETTLGVENIYEIARRYRVTAIHLGAEDLTADMRCARTEEGKEILYARSRISNAAHACGLEVYDTPYTDAENLIGLKTDAETAKRLGFTGKAVISPKHINIVNETFSPSETEINNALEVLEAVKEAKKQRKGVISLHGKMIDAPIELRARQTLEAAKIFVEENQ